MSMHPFAQEVVLPHHSTIGWDGTFNGNKAPEGNYQWIIYFRDTAEGKKEIINGSLTLLR